MFGFIAWTMVVAGIQLLYWGKYLSGYGIEMSMADFFYCISKLFVFPFTIGLYSAYLSQYFCEEEKNINIIVRMNSRKNIWKRQAIVIFKLSAMEAGIVTMCLLILGRMNNLLLENWSSMSGLYYLEYGEVAKNVSVLWMILYFTATSFFLFAFSGLLLLFVQWRTGKVIPGWVLLGSIYTIETFCGNGKFSGLFYGAISFTLKERSYRWQSGIKYIGYGVAVLGIIYLVGRFSARKKEFLNE